MEKNLGQITFTETEDGFRVEVSGKTLKDMFSCCCMPMFAGGRFDMSSCCPPAEGKK